MNQAYEPFLPQNGKTSEEDWETINGTARRRSYKKELFVHFALIALYTAISIVAIRSSFESRSTFRGEYLPATNLNIY